LTGTHEELRDVRPILGTTFEKIDQSGQRLSASQIIRAALDFCKPH
jgi:hypothetical protein